MIFADRGAASGRRATDTGARGAPRGERDVGWRPTRRLGGLLVLGTLAYVLAAQSQAGWLYLGVAVLGGALPIGLVYPLLAVRGLRGTARVIAPAAGPREGVEMTMELTLTNPGRLPRYWLVLHDRSHLGGDDLRSARMAIAIVPSLGRVEGAATVCPPRRGVFAVPNVVAVSRAPFGLAQAWAQVPAQAAEVVVAPRWWDLVMGTTRAAATLGSGRPRHGRTANGEFYGARPYRVGDSVRRIHWRSSARHDELVVRESEEPGLPALSVVLVAASDDDSASFDVGVRLAASAARWAARHAYSLHLHSTCAAPLPPHEGASLARLDDYLARVSGLPTEPTSGLLHRLPPSTLVLVIMPAADMSVVSALVALHRRTPVLTVAVGHQAADPDAETLAFLGALQNAGVSAAPFAASADTVDVVLC